MLIPLKAEEPARKFPIVTVLLIAANVAVFAYQKLPLTSHGRDLASIYGAIPYELTHVRDLWPYSPYSPYISLLTYMFLHGGLVHLIGNMLFLNAFGPNIENVMGHARFLLFYILCGVVSVFVYIIPNFKSIFPLVGASGAIAGVMGAHLRALPGTRILCLILIFQVSLPALLILLPWILLQFYNIITHVQSNVAWLAHIGGFVFGILVVRSFQKR